MIVINGMEMPKNCNHCRFNYDQLCHAAMQSFGGRRFEKNGRLKDCPLIEVTVGLFSKKAIGSDKTDCEGTKIETLPISCNEERECPGYSE